MLYIRVFWNFVMDYLLFGYNCWQIGWVIVVVCFGQGLQIFGFFVFWFEFDGVIECFVVYFDVVEVDLCEYGIVLDVDMICDMCIVQLFIVVVLLIVGDVLVQRVGCCVDGIVGYLVGEIVVFVGSDVIDVEIGMCLVGICGCVMVDVVVQIFMGMSVVFGGDEEVFFVCFVEFDFLLVNYNGGGQIVVVGVFFVLVVFVEEFVKGICVVFLQVVGVFYMCYMIFVVVVLCDVVFDVVLRDLDIIFWLNCDGFVVVDGVQVFEYFVDQVLLFVCWDLCMQFFVEVGVIGVIEFVLVGVLVGFVKCGFCGVLIVVVKIFEDFDVVVVLLNGEVV